MTSDSIQATRLVFETIGRLRFLTGRTRGRFSPPFLLSLDCLFHAPPTDSVRAVDGRPVHGWPVSGLFHPAHQVVASSEVRAVRHRRVVGLLEPFVRSHSLRALVARTKVVIEAGERHTASLEQGLGFLDRLDVREASRRRPNVIEPEEYPVHWRSRSKLPRRGRGCVTSAAGNATACTTPCSVVRAAPRIPPPSTRRSRPAPTAG